MFKEKKPVGTGDFLCRGHDVRRIRGLLQVIFGSLPFSPWKVENPRGWMLNDVECFHGTCYGTVTKNIVTMMDVCF